MAHANPFHPELDRLFTSLDTHHRMMGAVTVRKSNRVLYERVIGVRDSTAVSAMPPDLDTKYRLGSATQLFTAVLVYQLVDARRLTLETHLERFFPQMPGSGSITIAQMLGHTSGLPECLNGREPSTRGSRLTLLKRIADGTPQFAAGTQRRYCSSNYLLLGQIAEAAGGASYDALLRQYIVGPLALRRTHFGSGIDPTNNEARAYVWTNGRWTREADHAIEQSDASASVASTTYDLTLVLSALFRGKLMSGSMLREMTTGLDDGTARYGKGLNPFTIVGTEHDGFLHEGSIGAHSAIMGYVPADSLAVALTINGHNYPQQRIFSAIWSILYSTTTPFAVAYGG